MNVMPAAAGVGAPRRRAGRGPQGLSAATASAAVLGATTHELPVAVL